MAWSMRLPAAVQRVVPALIHGSARLIRPLTIGVRAALLRDGAGGAEVFLVRHTYVPGWHLPGGAVEPGETVADALVREVREECGAAVDGTPELFGLYFNRRASRRDHVAVYRVHDFRVLARREPTGRSPRPPSSRSAHCRKARPRRHAPGSPRCAMAGGPRRTGDTGSG